MSDIQGMLEDTNSHENPEEQHEFYLT
jgi:hypothetical protein